jgi:hypothetical protein
MIHFVVCRGRREGVVPHGGQMLEQADEGRRGGAEAACSPAASRPSAFSGRLCAAGRTHRQVLRLDAGQRQFPRAVAIGNRATVDLIAGNPCPESPGTFCGVNGVGQRDPHALGPQRELSAHDEPSSSPLIGTSESWRITGQTRRSPWSVAALGDGVRRQSARRTAGRRALIWPIRHVASVPAVMGIHGTIASVPWRSMQTVMPADRAHLAAMSCLAYEVPGGPARWIGVPGCLR